MRITLGIVCIIALIFVSTQRYVSERVVKLVDAQEDDVCGSVHTVESLQSRGTPLRASPTKFSKVKGWLDDDTRVIACETVGQWLGVIAIEAEMNCIDRKNKTLPRSYKGPCRSGWIHKSFAVTFFAG